jgi:hypothetical protein
MVQRRRLVIMLGTALVIAAARAAAHGGGLDKQGCHRDGKNGGYHCHKGELAGQSFPSKEAAQQALQWGGRNGGDVTDSTVTGRR